MILLISVHLLAALAAPAMARALGRKVFMALAIVPLATFVWAVLNAPGAAPVTQTVSWIPSLGTDLAFRMGALQWLLTLVVAGVGALVLFYCASYFHDDDRVGSFAATFIAFAGSMLGLVLADDLLMVYVFWEMTTVFSYLLIGYDMTKRSARLAAMQALIVTTFGGLAMLVGMLMLGHLAGTMRISKILADPPAASGLLTAAVMLVLVGALSKSAIVPFHFWLPGAMSAPTPVSAYLHAASMVKAGVYLVALLAPAFAGVPGWRAGILTLGVLTMLVGGWRSLVQCDVKLILAYGTVSQLGFLLVVLSVGTRAAALAGVALLLAHALFKSCLFLVVGIIDHNAGNRDLRTLSGLGRRSPVLFAAAAIAGASMVGFPPLLGFVAKESVLTALVDVTAGGDGTGLGPVAAWTVLVGVVVGSIITTAYTLRFLWGAFADKPGVEATDFKTPSPAFLASPVVLAVLSIGVAFFGGPLTKSLEGYTHQFPPGAHEAKLALWHGLGLPLGLSVLALVSGALMFVARRPIAHAQTKVAQPWSAQRAYLSLMHGVDRLSVEVTGFMQRGSVSAYLAVTLVVLLAFPGVAMLMAWTPDVQVHVWDTPAQAAAGLVVVLAAIMTARARRRLRAALLVGVTGYGCAVLFVLQGAPDLALTQVLVETASVIAFVLVLRRLPTYFTDRPLSAQRYVRALLGLAVGAAVAGIMIVATNARTAQPVSVGFPEASVDFGGGKNIVSVTLVDIRAWDTMGEISVLVAAATGVASLLFIGTRRSTIRRVGDLPQHHAAEPKTGGSWLSGPSTLAPEKRSIIFEVVTRLVFPAMVMVGVYLLFAGHNFTGGGFAGGIVTGLALVVRYLAGGRYELDEAAPIDAGTLLGVGLVIAAGSGLAPLAFGGAVLESYQYDVHLPLLGDHHLVTSLFFDIGVYLVVVGLILDLLRAFGSRIDRQIISEERDNDATNAEVAR